MRLVFEALAESEAEDIARSEEAVGKRVLAKAHAKVGIFSFGGVEIEQSLGGGGGGRGHERSEEAVGKRTLANAHAKVANLPCGG